MCAEAYQPIVWCADDMTVGNKSGNYNGLNFINPDNDSSIAVVNATRTYKNRVYDKAIRTYGYSNPFNGYIPLNKAVSFAITKPCDVVIYAYGTSSDSNVGMRISNSNGIVASFQTVHSVIREFKTFLPTAGTYYIYSTNGSLSICEIKRGLVLGDLDQDFDLDWNDRRLALRYTNGILIPNDEQNYKIDVNNDGLTNINDTDLMLNLMDSTEKPKAYFYNSNTWNVSNMPSGAYQTYDGIEMVARDLNNSNNSVKVVAQNGTYTDDYGTKTFSKCIKTDGYKNGANNNYPITKAIKINVGDAEFMDIYAKTGSSDPSIQRLSIYDADGVLVQNFEIDTYIDKYSFRVEKWQTYFISSTTGAIKVFEIDLNENSNINLTDLMYVVSGNTYKIYLSGFKLRDPNENYVQFIYDPDVITINSIGGKIPTEGKCPDGTEILDFSSGYIDFIPYILEDGECGLLTEVTFTANQTGNTTLSLRSERRND